MASSISETKLLRPIDSSLLNENDWPDFLLTGAEVSDSKTGELTSLLGVGAQNPCTLVGKLAKSRDLLPHLLNDKVAEALPAKVEVDPVAHFCYGQDDEGNAILWAAGRAGWFQIQPSRAYKPTYKRSCEAINALYFLSDFYMDLKGRKLKSTPVEAVFEQYAADGSNHCSNDEQAQQVFSTHKEFLLDCMRRGKEGVNWKMTSIYDFLSNVSQPSSTTTSEDELNTQTPEMAGRSLDEPFRRHVSKSSLRPRSTKYPLKGIGRRHELQGVGSSCEDQGTLQSPLKRKATTTEINPRKRTMTLQEPINIDDRPGSDHDSSEDVLQAQELPVNTAPVGQSAGSRKHPRIKIVEDVLPSYEPQGPGDTWTCTFDGCLYRVYDARKPENQDLIRDHYKQHAFESQAQIDLIYQEERPYLPVNNLIKRIREMASKSKSSDGEDQEMAGAGDSEYPKPIRRKWP